MSTLTKKTGAKKLKNHSADKILSDVKNFPSGRGCIQSLTPPPTAATAANAAIAATAANAASAANAATAATAATPATAASAATPNPGKKLLTFQEETRIQFLRIKGSFHSNQKSLNAKNLF